MEFLLLGPLEVSSQGRLLDLGGLKQRALLALLLLEANRVVSRERLIDALWEQEPPETARKALQVYVSQLRKLLGRERLLTRPPGYLLSLDGDELDLARFEELHQSGRLEDALALWRGAPLAELAEYEFARAEAVRLDELRLACLEERLERDLDVGKAAEVVGELEVLVREQPLRERPRGLLMLALYRCGRQAEALAAYQDARRVLVDDLGIEPSQPLRELHQRILNQDPALQPSPVGAAGVGGIEQSGGVFVGRERELTELLAGLNDAFAGRGRLFLLVGEPGIGKSRLAEELIAKARGRGARVLVGRCWEAGGAPAYWPWVQSLRSLLREIEPEAVRAQLGAGTRDLAQLLPELRDLDPDLPEPLSSEGARFRLFEAVSSFVRHAARSRPLVLGLDDLHAADEPSLLLLQFLAREIVESRVLIVGAYRDVDPTPTDTLTTVLTELVREPVTRRLALAGWGESEVARFVELLAGETPSEELLAAISEETEGNPLFVGEIVRLLAAEGELASFAGSRLMIPQSVREVIERRLRRLSDECYRLLLLASVLGREFALDALARMGGLSEEELLDTLDEAMAVRIVADVPGNSTRLRFAHVLIRDTLYEGLTTARRVRLHRQAADTLESLYGAEEGPHLAELAHHSIAGSEFAKGLTYARRAGDRALALFAYEEAARLFETALDTLELSAPNDESTRCELLLALAEAAARAGNTPSAKRAALVAAEIARTLGLPRELARAAASFGGRVVWERAGNDQRLVPLLEEGLAALGDTDLVLKARLLARLAGALRDEHSPDRRDTLSREAVELARQTGSRTALAYALDGRALAISSPHTCTEVLALTNELCELSQQTGDKERLVQAHADRFIVETMIGDLNAARTDLDLASRIASELRQPAQLALVVVEQAMLALAEGRLDDGKEFTQEAFKLGQRSHSHLATSAYRLHRYAICDYEGTLDEIEPALATLEVDYPARPALHCVLTLLYAKLDRPEAARQHLERLATDEFAALPFDMEWLYGISFLAETSALLHLHESAAVLHKLLLPHARLNVADTPEGIRGSVSRYLGLTATTLEHWDDAASHFQDALAMNANMGLRPWLARTQNDYADMLIARDRPGDHDQARQLREQAHATYHELGMKTDIARTPPTVTLDA
jgi:DNA-binding SARP family transcriptional activator